MSDPMLAGYAAYTTHSNCALLNGYAPADRLQGSDAIKYHLPGEQQDLLQFARPHDTDWIQWVRGWDQARADAQAGKVAVTEDVE